MIVTLSSKGIDIIKPRYSMADANDSQIHRNYCHMKAYRLTFLDLTTERWVSFSDLRTKRIVCSEIREKDLE